MKKHNSFWLPPPLLFYPPTSPTPPPPLCDWLNSCGVQQFMILRRASWPRLLIESLRGNLISDQEPSHWTMKTIIIIQPRSSSLWSLIVCVSSLAPPTVQIQWLGMNWWGYTDLRCECRREMDGWMTSFSFHWNFTGLTAGALFFNKKMSSRGRQRLARGVWTSCCGSDQSEDRGHHRPGRQHCWGPAGNTHLDLHLPAHSSISTGWQSILICVCVFVFVWLGGKLWRWRTVRTSLWLWAGKSLPVSWSSQDNVALSCF